MMLRRIIRDWLDRFLHMQSARSQDVIKGSVFMLSSSLVGNLCRVGLVMILSRYYVKEEFGIWAAITSTAAVIATGDFGIINSLRNKMSELNAKGDRGLVEAKDYFYYAFIFFLIFSIFLSLLLLGLSQILPFDELFKTDNLELKRQGVTIILWIQFLFFLNIPLGMGGACFFSFNESKYSAVFSLGQSVSSFILVLILSLGSFSIVTISISYFIINVLTSGVGTFYFLIRRKWLNRFVFNFKDFYHKVKELFGSGIKFMGLQLSNSFLQNAGTIVAGSYLGLSAAATFNMAQKLFTLAVSIYQSIFNPIWGGYADAAARKDWMWCKSTLNTSLKLTAAIFMVATIVMYFLGNVFLKILAGSDYMVNNSLFLFLGLNTVFYILFTSASVLQLAIGKITILLGITLFFSVCITPFIKVFADNYAIDGIAIASSLVWLLMLIMVYLYSNYIIKRGLNTTAKSV